MNRPDHWERMLAEYVADMSGRSFAWGVTDCATFAFGWAERLLGCELKPCRVGYATPGEARQRLHEEGLDCVEDVARRYIGAPLLSRKMAQRGDLVLGAAYGICLGSEAVFVTRHGVATRPMSMVRLAWRL